jgi:hypothetical protein
MKAFHLAESQYRNWRGIFEKKDSGSARQGETANTRNVPPPESP